MTPDAERIWGILRRHVGSKNAISAGQIARALELPGETTVRAIITENYTDFPAPIAGGGRGLFIISPEDPLSAEAANHYLKRLVHHAGEIRERERLVRMKLQSLGYLWQHGGGWYLPKQRKLFDDTGNPNPVPTGGAMT